MFFVAYCNHVMMFSVKCSFKVSKRCCFQPFIKLENLKNKAAALVEIHGKIGGFHSVTVFRLFTILQKMSTAGKFCRLVFTDKFVF